MFQQNNSKFAIFGGNAFTCLRQNLTYPVATISLAYVSHKPLLKTETIASRCESFCPTDHWVLKFCAP